MNNTATFEMNGKAYETDFETLNVLRSIVPPAKAAGDFSAVIVDDVKPFKVRASCGHIVIRKMREATAGVPYTEETILDAPNGRACDECEAKPRNATPQEAAIMLRLTKEGVHPSDIDRRTAEEVAAQTKAHIELVFGKPKVHLTLSGGNGNTVRSVYADGEEIGTVRQHRVSKSWFALGMHGEQHGFYTTDWNAAKQLALGQGMDPQ